MTTCKVQCQAILNSATGYWVVAVPYYSFYVTLRLFESLLVSLFLFRYHRSKFLTGLYGVH